MTAPAIQHLRIHLYGTQGSGSIFPSREERRAIRRREQIDLLQRVFMDLSRRTNAEGRIMASIEDVLGGPVSHDRLAAYAADIL